MSELQSEQVGVAAAGDEENSETVLIQYIKEREEKIKVKQELRARNQPGNVDSLRLSDERMQKLDSSIKKVTSYIKRLKTLTESQKDALAKDMQQLNLTKYLSEVATAFTEAKLKMNDLACAIHLCSMLHQSYAEFRTCLFEQWQKVLTLKKDEKVQNPSKMRVDLRFFAELITINVLPSKEALSLLGNQLTILTTFDKDFSNISIIISFLKHCGEDFANLVPAKYQKLSSKYNIPIPDNNIFAERHKAVRGLFKDYFKSLSQHLVNEHKEIVKLERQNKKIYQTKGELHSEKKEKYDQYLTGFKKMLEHVETLADLLNEQVPDLPMDDLNKKEEDYLNIDLHNPTRLEDFESTLWEDEETRQFYENLPDLRAFLPAILYKENVEVKTSEPVKQPPLAEETPSEDMSAEIEKIEKELEEMSIQQTASSDSVNEDLKEDSVEPDSGLASNSVVEEDTSGAQNAPQQAATNLANINLKSLMDSFVNDLSNCVNREKIDHVAKEFCLNLNTKTHRKRLVNALFQVQRTRLDLLPFYSRLVAILNPIIPEISTDLNSLLLNEFRYLVRKKDQINIESKIKVSRFLGELVKFNMLSKPDVMNCLKTLLADFRHHNIEMFCNMLDVCGRYLYRNPETHMKMKLILEILMRKKQAAMSMDNRYVIMIENTFYYCNPPETKSMVERKAEPPLHVYIRKVLYKDLNKLCVEKVLRTMRKLNWEDEETRKFSVRCLTDAWNVRYNSIHCLANLVSGLSLYYEDVGIEVVDGVVEDIRVGLEINLVKFNQRRISMVKYLGELYNYRMVESMLIFSTLYTLITYGVSFDVNENRESSLDPVDNFFRIRLVCVLLDTCGQYFDRGSTKKKLDCFLTYFQRYYLFKKENLNNETVQLVNKYEPLDVEFLFTETLTSLRPSLKFFKSYVEACDEVVKMENEIRKTLPSSVLNENQSTASGGNLAPIAENSEMSELEDEDNRAERNSDDDDDNDDDEDGDEDYFDEDRERTDSLSNESNSDEMDDLVVQKKNKNHADKDLEDDDFVKEFESFVTENIAQRTKDTIKMPSVDISVPMVSKKVAKNETISFPTEPKPEPQVGANKFNFIFMTKKGNKTQYHNMEVPVNSEFANQFIAKEEAERAEKEKLKQLTLNINERMEQEELQEMMQNSQVSIKFASQSGQRGQRQQKFVHQKGVPSVDAIFGVSPVPTSSASTSSSSNRRSNQSYEKR